MKNLLLTGASGFLGWNICAISQKGWAITGVSHKKEIRIDNVQLVKADLTDFNEIKKLFDLVKPDGVIHAAAQADPNYCQQNREETNRINTEVPVFFAQLCADWNIPFVFTSTDLVFDGLKGNYSETDAVNPVNIYGLQKVNAEDGIRKVFPAAAICRMPLMFGDGGPVAKSFIQPFLQKMRAGEPLTLFYDEYRSAVGGQSAAKGLLLALDKFNGTYHMGGRERLSRFDFGLLLKKVSDIPQAIMSHMSQKDVTMAAPRPADVSLNSSKAYSMGYEPLGTEDELRLIRKTIG